MRPELRVLIEILAGEHVRRILEAAEREAQERDHGAKNLQANAQSSLTGLTDEDEGPVCH